jgi:hypothetical protein
MTFCVDFIELFDAYALLTMGRNCRSAEEELAIAIVANAIRSIQNRHRPACPGDP